MPKPTDNMTTPLLIIKIVFDYFQVDLSLQTSKTRKREVVQARQISMYYIHAFTQQSQSCIGGLFNRDHATVIHAMKQVSNLSLTEKQYREDIHKLHNRILAKLGFDDFERYENFDTEKV